MHGQLGHDAILDEFWPSRLLLPDRIVSIDCGYAHTLVLTIKGQVWTFGCGLFGQMGMGGEVKKATVPSKVTNLVNIAHISCGHFHNLAFDREGQNLYIWGCNPQVLRLEAQQKRKNKLIAAAAANEDQNVGPDDQTGPTENKKLDEMLHLTPTQVDTSLFKVFDI